MYGVVGVKEGDQAIGGCLVEKEKIKEMRCWNVGRERERETAGVEMRIGWWYVYVLYVSIIPEWDSDYMNTVQGMVVKLLEWVRDEVTAGEEMNVEIGWARREAERGERERRSCFLRGREMTACVEMRRRDR